MCRYAGNAETRTLFQRHAFGELNDLFHRNRGELSRSSERSIGLSAVTPDRPTDPFTRHSFTDRINGARTIADVLRALKGDIRLKHIRLPHSRIVKNLRGLTGRFSCRPRKLFIFLRSCSA
jgi:hypothetical protein